MLFYFFYFQDVGVKTLQLLDSQFQWDNLQKSQFYKVSKPRLESIFNWSLENSDICILLGTKCWKASKTKLLLVSQDFLPAYIGIILLFVYIFIHLIKFMNSKQYLNFSIYSSFSTIFSFYNINQAILHWKIGNWVFSCPLKAYMKGSEIRPRGYVP